MYDNLVRATGVRNQLPGVNVYQSPNGTGYVDDYGRKVNARGEVLGPDGYALRVQPPPPAGGLGTGLRQDSHDVQPSQFPVFPGTTPGALPGTLPGTVPPLPGQLGYPYPGYPTPYQGYPAGGVPGYTPPTSYGGTPLPPMPGPVDPMQGLGYGYPDPYAAYLQPGFNPLDPYGLLQPTTQNNQMVWDPVTQSFYSNQVNQAYDPNTDTFSPTMNYNPYSSYLDPAIAGWVYSRPFRSTGQYLSELDKSPGVGTALRELYGRGVGHPATTRDAVVQRALPAGVRALYNNPAVRALLGT